MPQTINPAKAHLGPTQTWSDYQGYLETRNGQYSLLCLVSYSSQAILETCNQIYVFILVPNNKEYQSQQLDF